jgi:hypothetical protein
MFVFPAVGSLDADQAREALVVPATDEGVHWSDDALDRVVELTMGFPYFLQEFGKQAWDAADGPEAITLDDVQRSVPVAMAELDDSFFRARTGRTTNPERAYLRAMAELGHGPVRSAEVAALLGKKVTALGPTRDGLIKKALCYSPRWGEIDFTVPMFGDIYKAVLPRPRFSRWRGRLVRIFASYGSLAIRNPWLEATSTWARVLASTRRVAGCAPLPRSTRALVQRPAWECHRPTDGQDRQSLFPEPVPTRSLRHGEGARPLCARRTVGHHDETERPR